MNSGFQSTKKLGKGMLILAWLVALVLLTLAFGSWEDKQYHPNKDATGESRAGYRSIELKRNRFGHYISDGTINGRKVIFFLDTGATSVAVPAGLAHKLQLQGRGISRVSTANGVVEVQNTRIDALTLGPIQLHDVSAVITPGMKGEEILLGMSVLKHLNFSQNGDTLILEQFN